MDRTAPPTAMTVQQFSPSPLLTPYIEHFGLRQARLGDRQMYLPLPARSDCFLEIYLADCYRIVNVASGAIHRAPRLSLVGPHTRRSEDLLLSGTLRVFHIHFTPTGFRALFGIPAHLIADSAEAAEAVLGPGVLELTERLLDAQNSAQLVALAERFLISRLPHVAHILVPIAAIARTLKQHHGSVEIAQLAAMHSFTTRHLERVFREHIGVTPKTFARLARLSRALDLSQRSRNSDWAEIALAAGFYDQSHMVRDFRSLTGETPLGFIALRNRAANIVHPAISADDVAFVLSPPASLPLASNA
jgi:AraC-like DNA-binding protein